MKISSIQGCTIKITYKKPVDFYALSSVHGPNNVFKKASSLMGKGFATPKAIETLQDNPGFLVSYFLHTEATFSDFERMIALNDGENTVIAYRDARVMTGKEVYFFMRSECRSSLKTEIMPLMPRYHDPAAIIDIAWQIDKVDKKLPRSCHGFRDDMGNSTKYVTSNPYMIYDVFSRISEDYNLPKYRALDLGSGIGTVAFIGSHFFMKFTGIEYFKPLYSISLGSENQLRQRNSLKSPVDFINRDFMEKTFDLNRYDLIYLFRPHLYDVNMLIDRLHDVEPGTFILANAISEMRDEGAFHRMDMPYLDARDIGLYVKK